MRYWKRIVSLMLATVMLSSVCLFAASCKKKTSSVKKVSASDPWYSTKKVELDPKIELPENAQMFGAGPFLVRDRYLMQYSIFSNHEDTRLGIFDSEGKLLHNVDLDDIMNHEENFYGYFSIGFSECKSGVRMYYTASMSRDLFYRDIDLDTGLPVGSYVQIDLSSIKETGQYILQSLSLVEGYEVIQYADMNKGDSRLIVAKDGAALYEVDFSKAFGENGVKVIREYYGAGNGKMLFFGMGQTPVSGVLDLKTGQVTRRDDVREPTESRHISTTIDGRAYLTKATGIYEYSLEDNKEVCKLNFDNCSINRSDCQRSGVLYLDENKVVLGCMVPPETSGELRTEAIVYMLEKQEKNPNEGKSVITVASLSESLSYFEGEALRIFNETNPDYFAQLILYDQSEYMPKEDVAEEIDENDRRNYSAMSMVSGTLTQDIRSGSGPDVILGASRSIDLLDGKYLMDLSSYFQGKTYDASLYYSNIIDAAKMDGKTYFVPTSFTYSAIITDGSKMDPGKTGFSYDDYSSFVSGQTNGIEPVTKNVSRMHFLSLCVERSYAQWIKSERVDFNTDDFRKLAQFFKDTIPAGVLVPPPDKDDVWSDAYGAPPVETPSSYVESIDSLADVAYYNFYHDNIRILGLPSQSGEGLSATVMTSFSVTAGTKVKEGAFALLDILLSDDVQKETRDAIAVNRTAVRYKVDREVENSKQTYDFYAGSKDLLFPMEDLLRMGGAFLPGSKLSDIFLKSLEDIHSIFLPDNSVLMIISEEIPAYLLGQKDIDTVIATINNRAKTVFDER